MNIFVFSWVDCKGLPHFFIYRGSRKKAENRFENFKESLDGNIKPVAYSTTVYKGFESIYISKYSNKKLS